MFGRASSEEDGGARGLAAFSIALIGLAVAGLVVDTIVRNNAMQADPGGYPVRVVIPEPFDPLVKRPPPVLLGENVELISAVLAEAESLREDGSGPKEDDAFERAFGSSPRSSSLARSEARTLPKPDRSGMLRIDFDLQGGAESPRAVSVDKPVAIGNATNGKLAIRIDGAAQIFANRGQLASLLDSSAPGKAQAIRGASTDEFMSFTQLRDLGVNIRYDPSADRIVIPVES